MHSSLAEANPPSLRVIDCATGFRVLEPPGDAGGPQANLRQRENSQMSRRLPALGKQIWSSGQGRLHARKEMETNGGWACGAFISPTLIQINSVGIFGGSMSRAILLFTLNSSVPGLPFR